MRPKHPIRLTWWIRVPGFVVGLAALNRADWLHDQPATITDTWWRAPFVWVFTVVGVLNLVWHTTAPWRTRSATPWVAFATFAAWGSYAFVILVDLGWDRVRATSLDLFALALLIAWSWGPDRVRIDA